MLKIGQDELNKIEKVMLGLKDPNTGEIINDIMDVQVKFGGKAIKRCAKKSKWYLVDDNFFQWYLKRSRYFYKMYELKNNEWVRVDGFGNELCDKDIRFLDKCIRNNKK